MYNFNKKFDIIITPNVSSVCHDAYNSRAYSFRMSKMTSDGMQQNVSHVQPYSEAKQSAADIIHWDSQLGASCMQ